MTDTPNINLQTLREELFTKRYKRNANIIRQDHDGSSFFSLKLAQRCVKAPKKSENDKSVKVKKKKWFSLSRIKAM